MAYLSSVQIENQSQSAFGETLVANLHAVQQGSFNFHISDGLYIKSTTGSATITHADAMATCQSSTTTGSLQFRLNKSENGGSVIATNSISMSTDYISDLNNFKYFNVMLQRDKVTDSYEVTQSYHMFIGRQDGDKIKDVQHVTMSSFNTYANQNFITSSGQTSDNLLFGEVCGLYIMLNRFNYSYLLKYIHQNLTVSK